MPRPRRAAVLLVAVLGLAGCSGSDPGLRAGGPATLEPGPSAGTGACTKLIDRLPTSLLDLAQGPSPATGTATWGGVVLRCGVAGPGPTTDSCINTDGIDWVFSEDAATYRFVTYGRSPAVEVTVPTTVPRTRAPGAMTGLADAVRPLEQSRTCD